MISKMIRYDIVLHAQEQERFVNELRELGLVDITTTGWESTESDRSLLQEIDAYNRAIESLESFTEDEAFKKDAEPYDDGAVAYDIYRGVTSRRAEITQRVATLEKTAADIEPWGNFSRADIDRLSNEGILLRTYIAQPAQYDQLVETVADDVTIVEINRTGSYVYFVVVSRGAIVNIDGQEVHLPDGDYKAIVAEIEALKAEDIALNDGLSRVACSIKALTSQRGILMEQLQGLKVDASALREADGKLLVLEGWAEADTAEKVDKLLETYPNLVYMRRDANIDDEAPVKLKNNKFARLFELIGSMYALPKYGTFDLTAIFGPFYMLFFAICLCDAGYGLVLLAVGLGLLFKGGDSMRQAAMLSIVCASATVAFGFYANSLFGRSISEYLPGVKFLDFQGQFFSISLAIGVIQILIGMAINIVMKAKLFGFTSMFGLLGWFIILLTGSISVGLPMFGVEVPGMAVGSPIFYGLMGVGALLMIVLNNVKRNPIVNIGAGLWDAYNNITGLLSDVLSYIRLFAIGLSGGVLAQVFNSLAMGLSGLDSMPEGTPWYSMILPIVAAAIILIIGHGINLFMSAISSFVHPMRLTFVEFYKNAGFEMGQRSFDPIRKMK